MWTRPAAANASARGPMPIAVVGRLVLGGAQQPEPEQSKAIGTAYATRPKRAGDHRVDDVADRALQAPPLAGGDDDGQADEGEADAVAAVLRLEVAGAVCRPGGRLPPATWAMPIQVPRIARSGSGSPPPLGLDLPEPPEPPGRRPAAGLRGPGGPPRPAAGRAEDGARPGEPERAAGGRRDESPRSQVTRSSRQITRHTRRTGPGLARTPGAIPVACPTHTGSSCPTHTGRLR